MVVQPLWPSTWLGDVPGGGTNPWALAGEGRQGGGKLARSRRRRHGKPGQRGAGLGQQAGLGRLGATDFTRDRRVGGARARRGGTFGSNRGGGIPGGTRHRADRRATRKADNGLAAVRGSEDHGGDSPGAGREHWRAARRPAHVGRQGWGVTARSALAKHRRDGLILAGRTAGQCEARVAVQRDVIGRVAEGGERQGLRPARVGQGGKRRRQGSAGSTHRDLGCGGQAKWAEEQARGKPRAKSHRHPILCQVLSVASQRMRMLTPAGSADPLIHPSTDGLKLYALTAPA